MRLHFTTLDISNSINRIDYIIILIGFLIFNTYFNRLILILLYIGYIYIYIYIYIISQKKCVLRVNTY